MGSSQVMPSGHDSVRNPFHEAIIPILKELTFGSGRLRPPKWAAYETIVYTDDCHQACIPNHFLMADLMWV